MKTLKAMLLSAALCLSISACGENVKNNFDQTVAFENMKTHFSENVNTDNYYIQMSKTQAEAHVTTEISKYEKDCAFLEYDVLGALKFFRNGNFSNISPGTFYQVDTVEKKWEDFNYEKSASIYRNVLNDFCGRDYSDIGSEKSILKEITVEENDNEKFPFRVTASFNLDNIDTKTLFNNGGNFGSLSIKFLSDEKGESFDEITLYIQYDYNDEIYVISAKFGDINLPNKKGNNGQRPEDIEKEYNKNLEELQSSYEQYLEDLQSNYAAQ